MLYFTSDLHHQHKRIVELTSRSSVTTTENHTNWLIETVNKRISNSDRLYLLGDISFSRNYEDVASFYRKISGQKFVVKGNHDDRKVLNRLVEDNIIQAWYEYKEISVNHNEETIHLCLMHFPIVAWHKQHYGSIHLFGHCHGSYEGLGKSLDVGIDNSLKIFGDYRVFSLEDVLHYCKERNIKSQTHHQVKVENETNRTTVS